MLNRTRLKSMVLWVVVGLAGQACASGGKPTGGACERTSECASGLVCTSKKCIAAGSTTDDGSTGDGSTGGGSTGTTGSQPSAPALAVSAVSEIVYVGERRSITASEHGTASLTWVGQIDGGPEESLGASNPAVVVFSRAGTWTITGVASNGSGSTRTSTTVTVRAVQVPLVAETTAATGLFLVNSDLVTPTLLEATPLDGPSSLNAKLGDDVYFSTYGGTPRVNRLMRKTASSTAITILETASTTTADSCGMGFAQTGGSTTCHNTPAKWSVSADGSKFAFMMNRSTSSTRSIDQLYWSHPGYGYVYNSTQPTGPSNPFRVVHDEVGAKGYTNVQNNYVTDMAIDRDGSRVLLAVTVKPGANFTTEAIMMNLSNLDELTLQDIGTAAGNQFSLEHVRIAHPRFLVGGRVVYSLIGLDTDSGSSTPGVGSVDDTVAVHVTGANFVPPRAFSFPSTIEGAVKYKAHEGQTPTEACAANPGATTVYYNSGMDHEVSTDGQQVVFTRNATVFDCAAETNSFRSELYLYNVVAGSLRKLSPFLDAVESSDEQFMLGAPRFVANDRQIVVFRKTVLGLTSTAYTLNTDPDFANPRKILGTDVLPDFAPTTSLPYGYFGCASTGASNAYWLIAIFALWLKRSKRGVH